MEDNNICKRTITKIEVQKRNKSRVNVYVDEEFLFACSAEIIYRFNLKSKSKIDIEYIGKIIEEDNYLKCKNDALKSLEKKYKTEKEIYGKLKDKGYSNDTINKVVKFLKDYNFLNDSKYADMYIKEKIRNTGKNKIKFLLLQKGIAEDIVKEKIYNIDTNIENQVLLKLAQSKYNQIIKRESDLHKIYKKLGDFLIRKGYNFEDVKHTLNKIIKNDFYE
ncbi:recombination regulator RecX [Clostridium rectalis]|uniref:recombination regulator RecX n=1 Tax=Clostridium rectalis TaxID=2040295 RepID=UPI001FAA5A88|nr:recombination regulator RecX [Clostridium rectalis]